MADEMKARIAGTLNDLLARKPLEKITVRELVDACHISRQTFYYHFQDLMEVLEWIQRSSLRQSVQRGLAAPTLKDALRGIVEEALHSREQLQQLLASQRHREIEQMLHKTVYSYLYALLRARAPRLALPQGDTEALLCFYAWGLVGLLLTGLQQPQPDVEVLSDAMYRLLTGQLAFPPETADGGPSPR